MSIFIWLRLYALQLSDNSEVIERKNKKKKKKKRKQNNHLL